MRGRRATATNLAFPDATEVRGTPYIRRRRRSQKTETDYGLDRKAASPTSASPMPLHPLSFGVGASGPTKLGFDPASILRTGPVAAGQPPSPKVAVKRSHG
jgi:hypothetical protein